MPELFKMTATELAPLIQGKTISPVELVSLFLHRIEKYDTELRTYITPLPELALIQAKEAENEIMRGIYKGPLHGIPIGIKDNYCTKGIRTTAGSKLLENFIPNQSATVVTKLLKSGSIMLGKQNMHELGAGVTGTDLTFGSTNNPWNNDYMPGGSSSGAAASLVAGLTTIATGSDTFGSIRVPASMCGVYGLKPTYGLISKYGIIPTAMSLDTAGPMARSVSDLALMLQYMAGYDPLDTASIRVEIPNYTENLTKGIKGIKIGIPSYYLRGLDPEVEKLFLLAVNNLNALGANIVNIEIPELELTTFAGFTTVVSEAAAYHTDWLKTHPKDYSTDVHATLLSGALTNSTQYLEAQKARRKMTYALQQIFEDVDLLIGPAIPIETPAWSMDWVSQNLDVENRCMPFTAPVNLTGTPSLTVPIGFDPRGLPVGMQIIGNHLSEELLLQTGHAFETII
ncbi:amidase [Rummeliibacillus sp. BSL5]